jgi:hypothetical protein
MTSITCPLCRKTSHNREDVINGYCAHCRGWTGTPMSEADYEAWRKAAWPPPGLDMGRRAEWLSPTDMEGFRERIATVVPYIRAVLTGDDSVPPDVATAEIALSLVCGWLSGAIAPEPLDRYLEKTEAMVIEGGLEPPSSSV